MACCAAHPDRGGVTVERAETTEGEVTPTEEGEVTPPTPNGEATPNNPPPPSGSSAYFLRRPRRGGTTPRVAPSAAANDGLEVIPASMPADEAPQPIRRPARPKQPQPARRQEPAPAERQVSHLQPRAGKQGATPSAEQPALPVGLIEGHVADIVHDQGYVVLKLTDGKTLPAGTRVKLNHRFAFTTKCLGELKIISTSGGKVLAKPLGSLTLATITRGDHVVYYRDPSDA